MRTRTTTCRGLTLLEMLLALFITALAAGSIAGMMNAVATGVSTREDVRASMVGSNLAGARLSAYVAPARCILDVDGSDVVIWLNDDRNSDTVHGTEIRWIKFDGTDGTYTVYFVKFPDGWSEAAKELEDLEHPATSNWDTVLTYYQVRGWIASLELVDGLESVAVTMDGGSPMVSQHLNFKMAFLTSNGSVDTLVPATVRQHEQPVS